ncbi:hypothetical protein [Ruegeria meonggei]|uniref:hypothetical protein n=1 Tax=Ruegeria meonggei TaxID=1446476 RepID=UPI003671C7E5
MEQAQRQKTQFLRLFLKHIFDVMIAPKRGPQPTPLPPTDRMARDIGLSESDRARLYLRLPSQNMRHPML